MSKKAFDFAGRADRADDADGRSPGRRLDPLPLSPTRASRPAATNRL